MIQMRVRFDSEGHVSVFVLFLGEMGRGYARLPFEDNRGCPWTIRSDSFNGIQHPDRQSGSVREEKGMVALVNLLEFF